LTLSASGCGTGNSIFKVTYPPGMYSMTDDVITDADACKLSGGKIDTFAYIPGLPDDPQERWLLQACRSLKINSRSAKCQYLMIKHRGRVSGVTAIVGLVVGDKILIVVDSFARFVTGAPGTPGVGCPIFLTDDPVPVKANQKKVPVGNSIVQLANPVVQSNPHTDLVMVWSDMLKIVQTHDKQYPGSGGRTIEDWWLADTIPQGTVYD